MASAVGDPLRIASAAQCSRWLRMSWRLAQRLLHRRDLQQDIGAVALRFDHVAQAAHLSLNPREASKHGGLNLWIHGRGFSPGLAGAGGDGDSSGGRLNASHLGWNLRRRRLLASTLIELSAMAALAIAGVSRIPKAGYKT